VEYMAIKIHGNGKKTTIDVFFLMFS